MCTVPQSKVDHKAPFIAIQLNLTGVQLSWVVSL